MQGWLIEIAKEMGYNSTSIETVDHYHPEQMDLTTECCGPNRTYQ
jgi:hypothetical protein